MDFKLIMKNRKVKQNQGRGGGSWGKKLTYSAEIFQIYNKCQKDFFKYQPFTSYQL